MSLVERDQPKRKKVIHIIEMTCEIDDDCEQVQTIYHDCSEDAICQVCAHYQMHEEMDNYYDELLIDHISEMLKDDDNWKKEDE